MLRVAGQDPASAVAFIAPAFAFDARAFFACLVVCIVLCYANHIPLHQSCRLLHALGPRLLPPRPGDVLL